MATAFVCQKCGMEMGDRVRLDRNGRHAECGGGIVERVVVDDGFPESFPFTNFCTACNLAADDDDAMEKHIFQIHSEASKQ